MGDIVTSNSQRPGRAKPFQGLKGVRVGPFMTLACSMETEKLFNIEGEKSKETKMAFSSRHGQEVWKVDTINLGQWVSVL